MIFNDAATLSFKNPLWNTHDKSAKDYNTDQFIGLDANKIIGFATAIYVEAEQKLRKEFEAPTYFKNSLKTFAAEVNGIISMELISFKTQIADWAALVPRAIIGANRATFEPACDTLRAHFGTVQRTIDQARDKLIAHYQKNMAYIPLILIELKELKPHKATSLIDRYSQQFELQFRKASDGLDTPLETKLKVARTSRLRFPPHTAYTVYNVFSKAESTQAKGKLPIHEPDSYKNRANVHKVLADFVGRLNKYGLDAFELAH